MVANGRRKLIPPTPTSSGFKATRPGEPSVVEPWFEVSPRVPSVDTRVGSSVGLGVVAWLEVFGGAVGPGRALAHSPEGIDVVVAGDPVPPGTPGPENPILFRRQCCLHLSVMAEQMRDDQQMLAVIPARGLGPSDDALVQVFAGVHALGQVRVVGDDRIAIVVDAPSDGVMGIDFWIRLCGEDQSAAVGFRGAQGFLL